MAIVKTTFTATTLADNAPEVLAFLQANAAAFFDSIGSSENVISCAINSVAVLKLSFAQAEKNTMTLLNGTAVSVYNAEQNEIFVAGYKTDNGVMLEASSGATYAIFKSSANSTALLACFRVSSSASYNYYMGDVANNRAWYTPGSASSIVGARQLLVINVAAALTSLTPLPLGNGGTYAPNLLVSCFTENGAITSVKRLSVNDIEYVYDGAFALRA